MKKTVKVMKSHVEIYEVESNNDDFSNEGALAIVQARMKAGMPLGLTKDEEVIVNFDVEGQLYGPDGLPLLAKKEEEIPTKPKTGKK
jgi:hypothetical protein